MAVHSYAQNFCLHRSLQHYCQYSCRTLLLCNNCCLAKKGFADDARNSNSGNSSNTHQNEESQRESVVQEVAASGDASTSYADDLSVPEEPTTCCMSGCANCVWIDYAEQLSKRYKDGGEKAREAIMKMSDANMRAFLLTELKTIKES